MLEEMANNWAIGLRSFLNIAQFTPTVPNLWDKQAFDIGNTNNTKINRSDVLLAYFIMFWIILFNIVYENFLNSLLRRMRIPLMMRSRIIEAVWICGFGFGSICYLKSSMVKISSFSAEGQDTSREVLGVILHKSFYFHQAGIEFLRHGAWIKGGANLLFASFLMNPYQEKWCSVVSTFLFYKALDTIAINICRILLCFPHFSGRVLPKLFFWLHCLGWTYLYILFVPKLMLRPGKIDYIPAQAGLWFWFIAECLDSIWLKVIRHAKATHWLEICVFPPPTQEAIELAGIQKRHKESLKKLVNRAPKKTELWQTLLCAMTIKQKIKRMRAAKRNDSESVMNSTKTELSETENSEGEEQSQ